MGCIICKVPFDYDLADLRGNIDMSWSNSMKVLYVTHKPFMSSYVKDPDCLRLVVEKQNINMVRTKNSRTTDSVFFLDELITS